MLALKAENISKQYRLGQVGTGTLSHDLNRFWHQVRGKEDPYLKIGEANDRASKGESEYVWSLRDISFEIEQGDAVGIIGRNGAGKSTLLKLLSKVTKPTTGKIYTNGRIASLLEVGTGFHPEMTGRENIYLNGAILGMTRKEITRKFDEIVDFSGVERYIDTPVKRYSSGMYVRLAFAVAAHLESEILIVDEVLAVGDAEFQKKCLGKMGDVSKGEGRTVLFVSHNLTAVSQLCNSGIYLKDGNLIKKDTIRNITDLYLKESEKGSSFFIADEERNDKIFFKKITIRNSNNELESSFDFNNEIIIDFEIANKGNIKNANIFVTIEDSLQNRVFSAEVPLKENKNNYYLVIEPQFLSAGSYNITSFIHVPQLLRYDELLNVCHFDVIDTGSQFVVHGNYHHGVVYGKFEWK
ncbi:MAG: ABC transporter ATP-binding protein [Flavobacteriales bacterium]|nr:ABC transporter ATP-binding protein [Flavobacteriales bacterium]